MCADSDEILKLVAMKHMGIRIHASATQEFSVMTAEVRNALSAAYALGLKTANDAHEAALNSRYAA